MSRDQRIKQQQKKHAPIRSKPTMCLHCHLIVTMTCPRNADTLTDGWTCPNCGHVYPLRIWNIRKQVESGKGSQS